MYIILVFLSFLQSVIGFTLMTSSVMLFKEPVRKRIAVGLAVMIFGICLLSFALYAGGTAAVERMAILIIFLIQLSWFLICSGDRFFVSLFSLLTFVNIYVSISFISDTLSIRWGGNAFVGARILIRLAIYLVILPLLFKFVRPRFRKLVEALDKEWRAATLVPLLFFLMQTMVLYYPAPYWHWTNDNWLRVIIVATYLLFLAVYYLLSIQAASIVEKYALEKRQLLMAQQEKLWESELARQEATAALVFQQQNDIHHLQELNARLINTQSELSEANTEMNRLNSELNNRLVKDELTGLVGRYQYRTEIEMRTHEQPDQLGVFIFLDIDHFKQINDSHGHQTGDVFLQIFSTRLQQIEYDQKICMRISGDEFGLYLHGFTSVDDVTIQDIWQEIVSKVLSEPAMIDDEALAIRCSAGMAVYGLDTHEIYDLIEYADFAMYQAKKQGKNTFQRFNRQVYQQAKVSCDSQTKFISATQHSGTGKGF